MRIQEGPRHQVNGLPGREPGGVSVHKNLSPMPSQSPGRYREGADAVDPKQPLLRSVFRRSCF